MRNVVNLILTSPKEVSYCGHGAFCLFFSWSVRTFLNPLTWVKLAIPEKWIRPPISLLHWNSSLCRRTVMMLIAEFFNCVISCYDEVGYCSAANGLRLLSSWAQGKNCPYLKILSLWVKSTNQMYMLTYLQWEGFWCRWWVRQLVTLQGNQ